MNLISQVLNHPVGLLFIIITLGLFIGRIKFGKMTLGGSGVLLVGLLMGHLGYVLPNAIQTIGVVLFVYSVGLRAGPYIVESIKKSKGHFLILSVVIVTTAGGLSLFFRKWLGLSPEIMTGIYAGSMTSTPALAASMEALGNATPSVGYGLAYPVGILGVILFVQLLPALLNVDLKEEEKKYREEFNAPQILRQSFKVTNPNLTSASIAESLSLSRSRFRIVRIKRDDRILTPFSDETLRLGDIVLAVGEPRSLNELKVLFGDPVSEDIPESKDAKSNWVSISSKSFVGKDMGHLEISNMYGVIISRVRRGGIEFIPQSNFVFEAGDQIRISGTPQDLERFSAIVGQDQEMLHETDILSFAFGLACGAILGMISIPLPGGFKMGFGIAGGPLIIGLLFGYIGRFGKMTSYMPKAANLVIGELGLYLFLAVAGCSAGSHFIDVFKQNGLILILCGASLTLLPIIVSTLIGRFILKMNLLVILGMICGGMTSTPALAVLTSNTKSDIPSLAYTSIYPISVLLTTLTAQAIALL